MIVVIVVAKRYRSQKHETGLFLLAPFSAVAFERFKKTVLLASGVSFGSIIRFLLTIFLVGMFLYNFFRAGVQVFAALDPNFTANAWGGPSYLGASLAHWLDGIIIFLVVAVLLNKVMVRNTAQRRL